MDTQNYLEQLLFNSFPGLKVNNIVPFAGFAPQGHSLASINFDLSNFTGGTSFEVKRDGIVLFDIPIYGSNQEKIDIVKAYLLSYSSSDLRFVLSDTSDFSFFVYQLNLGQSALYFKMYGTVYGIGITVYPKDEIGNLYYGNLHSFYSDERIYLFENDILVTDNSAKNLYLFTSVGLSSVYFIGYKISYENVPILPGSIDVVLPPENIGLTLLQAFVMQSHYLSLHFSENHTFGAGNKKVNYSIIDRAGNIHLGSANFSGSLNQVLINISALVDPVGIVDLSFSDSGFNDKKLSFDAKFVDNLPFNIYRNMEGIITNMSATGLGSLEIEFKLAGDVVLSTEYLEGERFKLIPIPYDYDTVEITCTQNGCRCLFTSIYDKIEL
ncbi:MAG: hypothetical protein ABI295_02365 [Xanthomarina sp.]